jgi:hypothetical protein
MYKMLIAVSVFIMVFMQVGCKTASKQVTSKPPVEIEKPVTNEESTEVTTVEQAPAESPAPVEEPSYVIDDPPRKRKPMKTCPLLTAKIITRKKTVRKLSLTRQPKKTPIQRRILISPLKRKVLNLMMRQRKATITIINSNF